MEDPERALAVLTQLADAGDPAVHRRLRHRLLVAGLPQARCRSHELKIDRAFVAALTTSERDRVIVDSTVALGARLGLEVVAEGVEDEDDPGRARRLGCQLAQGYLLQPAGARPTSRACLRASVEGSRRHGRPSVSVPPFPRGTSAPTLCVRARTPCCAPVGKPAPVTC